MHVIRKGANKVFNEVLWDEFGGDICRLLYGGGGRIGSFDLGPDLRLLKYLILALAFVIAFVVAYSEDIALTVLLGLFPEVETLVAQLLYNP